MKIIKRLDGFKLVFGGVVHQGWLPAGAVEPRPTPTKNTVLDLRIMQDENGGFFLEGNSSNPDSFVGDTWHQTLADAMEQAKIKWGIDSKEWKDGDA